MASSCQAADPPPPPALPQAPPRAAVLPYLRQSFSTSAVPRHVEASASTSSSDGATDTAVSDGRIIETELRLEAEQSYLSVRLSPALVPAKAHSCG